MDRETADRDGWPALRLLPCLISRSASGPSPIRPDAQFRLPRERRRHDDELEGSRAEERPGLRRFWQWENRAQGQPEQVPGFLRCAECHELRQGQCIYVGHESNRAYDRLDDTLVD